MDTKTDESRKYLSLEGSYDDCNVGDDPYSSENGTPHTSGSSSASITCIETTSGSSEHPVPDSRSSDTHLESIVAILETDNTLDSSEGEVLGNDRGQSILSGASSSTRPTSGSENMSRSTNDDEMNRILGGLECAQHSNAENAWGIQQIEAMKEEIKEMRKALENTNMENRHLRWVTNIMGHEKECGATIKSRDAIAKTERKRQAMKFYNRLKRFFTFVQNNRYRLRKYRKAYVQYLNARKIQTFFRKRIRPVVTILRLCHCLPGIKIFVGFFPIHQRLKSNVLYLFTVVRKPLRAFRARCRVVLSINSFFTDEIQKYAALQQYKTRRDAVCVAEILRKEDSVEGYRNVRNKTGPSNTSVVSMVESIIPNIAERADTEAINEAEAILSAENPVGEFSKARYNSRWDVIKILKERDPEIEAKADEIVAEQKAASEAAKMEAERKCLELVETEQAELKKASCHYKGEKKAFSEDELNSRKKTAELKAKRQLKFFAKDCAITLNQLDIYDSSTWKQASVMLLTLFDEKKRKRGERAALMKKRAEDSFAFTVEMKADAAVWSTAKGKVSGFKKGRKSSKISDAEVVTFYSEHAGDVHVVKLIKKKIHWPDIDEIVKRVDATVAAKKKAEEDAASAAVIGTAFKCAIKENETVPILDSAVKVLSAVWEPFETPTESGAVVVSKDVSAIVTSLIKEGGEFKVSNVHFGDPAVGKVKALRLELLLVEEIGEVKVEEAKSDATDAAASAGATDNAAADASNKRGAMIEKLKKCGAVEAHSWGGH